MYKAISTMSYFNFSEKFIYCIRFNSSYMSRTLNNKDKERSFCFGAATWTYVSSVRCMEPELTVEVTPELHGANQPYSPLSPWVPFEIEYNYLFLQWQVYLMHSTRIQRNFIRCDLIIKINRTVFLYIKRVSDEFCYF